MPIQPIQMQPIQQPDLMGQFQKSANLANVIQANQMNSLQLQQEKMKLAQMQQELVAYAQVQDIYSQEQDPNKAKMRVLKTVGPRGLPILNQILQTDDQIAKMDESRAKATKEKLSIISDSIDEIESLPVEQRPSAYKQKLQMLQSMIPQTSMSQLPTEYPGSELMAGFGNPIKQSIQKIDAKIKEATARESEAKATTAEQIAKGTQPISPYQQATLDKEKLVSVTQQKMIDWMNKNPGKGPSDYEAWQKNQQSSMNINNLTPEGLDIAAEMFAKTGQLPALGMGQGSMRSAIINRAAALHPSIDLASNRASYDANKSSLTQLQRNRDAIVSFENTALKNLDIFMNSARQVIDSGSPIINKPLRTIDEKALGSAELSAYQAARRVAINEIAKVTSNPNLTGQLSDAARKEVESFMPYDATLQQVYSVANVLKQDMTNRHESLDEQIQAIKQRISGDSSGQTPSRTIKVGQKVKLSDGREVIVKKVYPDGSFD